MREILGTAHEESSRIHKATSPSCVVSFLFWVLLYVRRLQSPNLGRKVGQPQRSRRSYISYSVGVTHVVLHRPLTHTALRAAAAVERYQRGRAPCAAASLAMHLAFQRSRDSNMHFGRAEWATDALVQARRWMSISSRGIHMA